jgi:hypothetical protein
MKVAAALLALAWLGAGSMASAQVQITAQTERTNFLLYERVDLLVTIINAGGTDLVLDNNEGSPWLSFLVSKHNRLPVKQERQSQFAPLTLKSGESKTLRINLTPLFSFREEGDYKAAAVIDLPGEGQIISAAVPFTVLNGRKIWSQIRPVDSEQRTYSLLRFSPQPDSTQLYLRVESVEGNIVYANLSLGEIASSSDPMVLFDPAGNVHLMQPISLGTYLYTRADPDGKILHQEIFKTFQQVAPRLAKLDDGNVVVDGGIAAEVSGPREKLSAAQHPIGAEAPPDSGNNGDLPAPAK